MSAELIEAGRALASQLARENAALAALDFAAATAVAANKDEIIERFVASRPRAATTNGGMPEPERVRLEMLARELDDLAAENRRLLEHAIAVQGRVVASIVRAIPRPVAGQHYGSSGMGRRNMPPVALCARA